MSQLIVVNPDKIDTSFASHPTQGVKFVHKQFKKSVATNVKMRRIAQHLYTETKPAALELVQTNSRNNTAQGGTRPQMSVTTN